MQELKKLEFKFSFKGLKYDIPLCCIIYFESAHRTSIRNDIPEYSKAKIHDHIEGIIKCPDCIAYYLRPRNITIDLMSKIAGIGRTQLIHNIKLLKDMMNQ